MKRILLVEDDAELAKLVQTIVAKTMPEQAAHFEFAHAQSGEEAIKLLDLKDKPEFHGLLVGRYNPYDDGLRIISMFRIIFPEARIALFSAETDRQYLNDAVRCGANVHIPKATSIVDKLQAFLLQILYKNALKFPRTVLTV